MIEAHDNVVELELTPKLIQMAGVVSRRQTTQTIQQPPTEDHH